MAEGGTGAAGGGSGRRGYTEELDDGALRRAVDEVAERRRFFSVLRISQAVLMLHF
jgi:hypothetical protein